MTETRTEEVGVRKHPSKVNWTVLEIVGLLLIFAAGYSVFNEETRTIDESVVTANTRFGFRLFWETFKRDPDRSNVLSPASLGAALTMAANGAAGETKTGMMGALDLEGLLPEEIDRSYAALTELLEEKDGSIRVALANALWARRGTRFEPAFIKRHRHSYAAEVRDLDFESPQAAATIDAWVRHSTGIRRAGAAPAPIDPLTVLLLVDTVSFSGCWTAPFDTVTMEEAAFRLPGGATKRVRMMRRTGEVLAYEDKEFQAVCLPCGQGRLNLYLFLPREDSSLREFCARLDPWRFESWLARFDERPGIFTLPRVRLACSLSLNDALKAMGMESAFHMAKADFSAMTPGKVFLSEVLHKTYVDLNERGANGSPGATPSPKTPDEPLPADLFSMAVDRPFFFAIRDATTGAFLFLGTVTDPVG